MDCSGVYVRNDVRSFEVPFGLGYTAAAGAGYGAAGYGAAGYGANGYGANGYGANGYGAAGYGAQPVPALAVPPGLSGMSSAAFGEGAVDRYQQFFCQFLKICAIFWRARSRLYRNRFL